MENTICFAVGILFGAAAVWLGFKMTQRAVSEERKHNEAEIKRLRDANASIKWERDAFERSIECADARRQGRTFGDKPPVDINAYNFAKKFEGRRASYVDTSKQG